MNRKTSLLVVFVLIVCSVRAQDYVRPSENNSQIAIKNPTQQGNRRFSLSINIGAAIPLQDFGSTAVKNSFWDFTSADSTRLQGFAKTGFYFNITAAYQVSKYIGIMALIGNSTNYFDENTFSATIGYPVSTLSTSFSTSEYLIGPYFTLPAGNKFSIKMHALLGLMANKYPPLDITLNDTTAIEIDFTAGRGFAYNFGIGAEYKLNNNVSITFNVAYTGTSISYNGWIETISFTGYYPFSISHSNDVASMSTGILRPTIGIEFKL